MTIDEALCERMDNLQTAIDSLPDDHTRRKALVALSHAVFALTGERPAPIRKKDQATISSHPRSRRSCLNIDKDGKKCVNPLSENAECPGFSIEQCKMYEPDAPCATCGGKQS